jgi:hypothetical protein
MRAVRVALHCSRMKVRTVARSSGSAVASRPSVLATNSLARCSFLVASATISMSENEATRRSGSRWRSRCVSIASRWLRRNPSTPASTGPMAILTSPRALNAEVAAGMSIPLELPYQVHIDDEVAIT